MDKTEELDQILFDTIKNYAEINPQLIIEMDTDFSKGTIRIKVIEPIEN